MPYTIYRYEWLERHPEAWNVPTRERRAVARAARSARRLGLRSPLRRRVAGRASAMARAVRRFGEDGATRATNGQGGGGPGPPNPATACAWASAAPAAAEPRGESGVWPR